MIIIIYKRTIKKNIKSASSRPADLSPRVKLSVSPTVSGPEHTGGGTVMPDITQSK